MHSITTSPLFQLGLDPSDVSLSNTKFWWQYDIIQPKHMTWAFTFQTSQQPFGLMDIVLHDKLPARDSSSWFIIPRDKCSPSKFWFLKVKYQHLLMKCLANFLLSIGGIQDSHDCILTFLHCSRTDCFFDRIHCLGIPESTTHALRDCPEAARIWIHLRNSENIVPPQSFFPHIPFLDYGWCYKRMGEKGTWCYKTPAMVRSWEGLDPLAIYKNFKA